MSRFGLADKTVDKTVVNIYCPRTRDRAKWGQKDMKVIHSDYLVIGSGVAGLFCALKAAPNGRVSLLTKGEILHCNTALAQGGVAAAVMPDDSPRLHLDDTLTAGAGACDPAAVDVLVREGVDRVLELAAMGVPFDADTAGNFQVAREAAHSRARVIPALGDGTGLAIARTLSGLALAADDILIHTMTHAVELLTSEGRCVGALVLNRSREPEIHLARAVVMATGGLGRIFARTTNSRACTGEGLAMARRAGAALADLEYIQFHPTALDSDEDPLPLISEAVRGHGAHLVNQHGFRFMTDLHPWAELAPRDVVARAIFDRQAMGDRIFLDARHLRGDLAARFPAIFQSCLERNLDIRKEPIPVTPAAHFLMGGISTDLNGATDLPGLFACGETACTGVHGANRLASNSLLEGLVFGHRAAGAMRRCPELPSGLRDAVRIQRMDIRDLLPPGCSPDDYPGLPVEAQKELIEPLRQAMWRHAGLVREKQGMKRCLDMLLELERTAPSAANEARNMITVARLVLAAALVREESRGGHFRSDFPDKSDSLAQHHIIHRKTGHEYRQTAA